MKQVKIKKHLSGKTYNVNFISWKVMRVLSLVKLLMFQKKTEEEAKKKTFIMLK
jgi:hypothetical protein